MQDAELSVRFTNIEHHMRIVDEYVDFNQHGFETIEFFIKTNKGNAFLPLSKTASGGELSRIMLALKSILAEKDKVDVLVFDEIDSGISGKIAEAVAREIKQLSKFHQIICITHSAQLAAIADNHFKVSKLINADSTETEIKKLDKIERINEIALLMSGTINETSKQLADELIMRSEKI
jgi:DNA repair protein RecN (Recombination protein N)